MRIIAIDPGNEQSAYVMWWHNCIVKKGIVPNQDLLTILNMPKKEVPLVVEMIASYGMPVGKTVFETCVWIGRFVQVWGGEFHYVYRKDVKMYLCGSMRAKDSNIRQALIDRCGKPGTKKAPNLIYGEDGTKEEKMKADLWAALAVAITYQGEGKA